MEILTDIGTPVAFCPYITKISVNPLVILSYWLDVYGNKLAFQEKMFAALCSSRSWGCLMIVLEKKASVSSQFG